MRKDVRARVEALEQTLIKCGYRQDYGNPDSFRKGRFHVIIRPRKNKIVVHLHKNSSVHSVLPARKTGKDLKTEFKNIMKKLRGS